MPDAGVDLVVIVVIVEVNSVLPDTYPPDAGVDLVVIL